MKVRNNRNNLNSYIYKNIHLYTLETNNYVLSMYAIIMYTMKMDK